MRLPEHFLRRAAGGIRDALYAGDIGAAVNIVWLTVLVVVTTIKVAVCRRF